MKSKIKFKKNLIFKRVLFLIMLVIAFCVIFKFSEQSGEESGTVSKKVTEFIIEIVSKVKTMDISKKNHYVEIVRYIFLWLLIKQGRCMTITKIILIL